ncbi:MAG: hypothetical protein V7K50_08435 [Nostoc sp.]|uniref:hypothetical protein n=1 Tax=Nostoc sp. TaxID=1180 RepID=UPI002FFCF4C7
MPKKKIKKTEVVKDGTSGIKLTKLKPPQGVSFSFKYYQDSNSKFSCSEKEVIYWLTLLDRLKANTVQLSFSSLSSFSYFASFASFAVR